jgi:hypothetical protein
LLVVFAPSTVKQFEQFPLAYRNALGTLAACAQHTATLTGTLLGGRADEIFNILGQIVKEGFEYGEVGVRSFTETYGLLEKITVSEPADNACSEARVTYSQATRSLAVALRTFPDEPGSVHFPRRHLGGADALSGGGCQR